MAVAHIGFNDQTPHGKQLRAALSGLENGLVGLNEILATFTTMVDGDGSQAAHFAYAADKFGFPDTATAKAAWDELNSLAAKLNTDASVAFVNAAILQACNKLR